MELSSQPAGWAHSVQPSFDLWKLEWFSNVTDGQDLDLRLYLRLNCRSFSSSHQMGSGIISIFCRNCRLHLVLMLKNTCCFSFTYLSFLHGVVHSFRHKLYSSNEVFRLITVICFALNRSVNLCWKSTILTFCLQYQHFPNDLFAILHLSSIFVFVSCIRGTNER